MISYFSIQSRLVDWFSIFLFFLLPDFSLCDLLSNAFGPLPPTPCYGFLYAESDCRKECKTTEKCSKYIAYADHREHLNEIYNCYNCVVAPWLISTAVLVPVAFIILVIIICCIVCKRRKRQKSRKQEPTIAQDTMIVSNIPQTIYYPEPQVQAKPQNFYVTQQPYSGSVVQHVVQQQQPTYIYQTLSQPKVVPLTKETLKQHEVMHQRTK